MFKEKTLDKLEKLSEALDKRILHDLEDPNGWVNVAEAGTLPRLTRLIELHLQILGMLEVRSGGD